MEHTFIYVFSEESFKSLKLYCFNLQCILLVSFVERYETLTQISRFFDFAFCTIVLNFYSLVKFLNNWKISVIKSLRSISNECRENDFETNVRRNIYAWLKCHLKKENVKSEFNQRGGKKTRIYVLHRRYLQNTYYSKISIFQRV